jgi:S1-C subfamily serine protease
MKVLLFSISLAFFFCKSSKGQALPLDQSNILVTVTTSYKDKSLLNSSKEIKIKGSGFFVSAFSKLFVVTASHVGSGNNTEITYNGKKLEILGELYDGAFDVQIFQVTIPFNNVPVMELVGDYIEWGLEKNFRAKQIDQNNFTLLNSWVFDPNLDIDNRFSQ